jgi:hypothetical protein
MLISCKPVPIICKFFLMSLNKSLSRVILAMVIFLESFAGCTTLKRVNDYSGTSLESIQHYEQINYTFTAAYMDLCRQEYFGDYSHVSGLDADSTTPLKNLHITLAQAKDLDKAMGKIYSAIAGYFDGLAKLSADSLTVYSIDTVTNGLETGTLVDTSLVSATTISAYGSIAGELGMAVTTEYRIGKIKKYMNEANGPLQVLISKFNACLRGSMHILLESQRQTMRDDIYISLLSKASTGWERKNIIDQYQAAMSELVNRERLIDTYTNGLDSVASGHAMLVRNLDKLKSKEVKDAIAKYTSRIRDLFVHFNTIRNSN